MRYLDYMEEHPGENLEWCRPYTDGNDNYLIMYDGGPLGIKTETEEVTERRELEYGMEGFARKVNKDYDLYSGYSDAEIALDAMHEVGCFDCPWKWDCDAMGAYVEGSEEEEG